jgi:peptidoglycan L-alanyl-D-glutamate endopeptidase CwlK
MFKFGTRSKACLETVDPRLHQIALAALANSYVDFGVTTGYRDEDTQNRLYVEGKSKVQYPDGKHNQLPSQAIDIVAYVKGKATYDIKYYVYLYGLFTGIARSLGYDIRSGLDWDRDGEIMTDQKFNDGCHFELVETT